MRTQIGTFRMKNPGSWMKPYISLALGLLVLASIALPAVAQTNLPCVSAPEGIMGWWPGDGTSFDEAGFNHGYASAAISFNEGVKGQAFEFFGSNQFVRIPSSQAINPTNAMTLECWVYISDFPTTTPVMVIAGKYDPMNRGQYLLSVIEGGVDWCFQSHLRLQTGERVLYGPGSLQPRTWYHVAMTYGNETFALYVNGQLAASTAAVGRFMGSMNPLTIGAPPTSGPYGLHGRVDELSLYFRALSAAEILSIFQSGSGGKCPVHGPPIITVQPASQTVVAGHRAVFEVTAARSSVPLSYQWVLGGSAVGGATQRTFSVTTQPWAQTLSCWVQVRNQFGSVRSSNAVLTVTYPSATPAVSGIVGWWKAERNMLDSISTNDVQGSVEYGPGRVGSSFSFTGTNTLTVPAASGLEVQSFTIEGWIKTSEISSTPRPIAEYAAETGHGTIHFWHNLHPGIQPAPGALYGLIRSTNGSYLEVNTAANVLPSNEWAHVAFTMDYGSGIARLYVDGKNLGSATNQDLGPVNTALPLNIGHRPEGSAELLAGTRFIGRIDELSLYGRALSEADILSIFNSSVAGKGPPDVTPFVTAHPKDQRVTIGNDAVFQVTATGAPPLSFQWHRNSDVLPGATTQNLVVSSTQNNDGSSYSVTVSNAYGFVRSISASLTLVPAYGVSVPSGTVAWWKAENNTQDAIGTNGAVGSNGLFFRESWCRFHPWMRQAD